MISSAKEDRMMLRRIARLRRGLPLPPLPPLPPEPPVGPPGPPGTPGTPGPPGPVITSAERTDARPTVARPATPPPTAGDTGTDARPVAPRDPDEDGAS